MEPGTVRKYGLDVQLIYIPSSGINMQIALGGSLDVSACRNQRRHLGHGARRSGAGDCSDDQWSGHRSVHPEYARADQLKGQTLGISRFNQRATRSRH